MKEIAGSNQNSTEIFQRELGCHLNIEDSSRRKGLRRLCKIIIGWKSKNAHETSSKLLLIVGFFVEFVLIRFLILDLVPNIEALGFFVRLVAELLIILLLVAMFYHQFMIFRNFSLPEKIGLKLRLRNGLARRGLLSENELCLLPIPVEEEFQSAEQQKEIIKTEEILEAETASKKISFVEQAVYLVFGVLTGEAGYMLTLIHGHDPDTFSGTMNTLQITKGGGAATNAVAHEWIKFLEFTFVSGAILVCALVLVWDILVRLDKVEFPKYKRLWGQFLRTDIASLFLWIAILVSFVPLFSAFSQIGMLLGICLFFWYIIETGKRIYSSIKLLGSLQYEGDIEYITL